MAARFAPGFSPPSLARGTGSPQQQQQRGASPSGDRIRLFRGQIVSRPPLGDDLAAASRIEVSSLSDIAGHGRYQSSDDEGPVGDSELPSALPPTAIPARFHIFAPGGRRIFPSERPTSREEVDQLERVYDTLLAEAGDDLLKQLDARDLVMSELARQVQPHCAERAELLRHIRALYYEHTSEALPHLSRVEEVEKALQEKREQLHAMQRDHAALTASRNRLEAHRSIPSKRVLRAVIAEEHAAKAPNPLISEFRRIKSVADRLQLLSEVFARLEPHEQLSVVARALDVLPEEFVVGLITEQLEALSPSEMIELMHVSLRAGTSHFGILQSVLNQLPSRKMVEFIDLLVQSWAGDGSAYAVTLFNRLSTDDRLTVLSSFRNNLSDDEYQALLGYGLGAREKDTLRHRLALRAMQRGPSSSLNSTRSMGSQAPDRGEVEEARNLTDKEALELAAKNHQAAWLNFDRSNTWGRFASAAQPSETERLDKEQVIATIAELFDDKVRANAAADAAESPRPPWAQFVYIWMMQRHSVKSRAVAALTALLDAVVRGARDSPRLRLFAIVCDLSLEHSHSPRRVDVILGVLSALYPNEIRERFLAGDGSLLVALHDSGAEIAASEAIAQIGDKHLKTYSRRILKYVENNLTEHRLVNVDELLLTLVEAFEDMTMKQSAGLEQLLHRYDENEDCVLSFTEFARMCERLNREAAEETVQALFMEVQEASERIDPLIGDALHPKAFSKIMQAASGFVDSDVFLDFMREMRLMPQEEE